ncbi:MAG: polysaccharide biosynthesis protein, partial [Candidatus Firestonebacteria bacterium]|nr:polysaccharide biosynthesis protein [Candidatus Firestonebacteria bacterium]
MAANQWGKINRFIILLFSDTFLISLALITAFLVRFDFNIPFKYSVTLEKTILIMVVISIVCFYIFGLYHSVLRYASVKDFIRILQSVTLSSLIFATIIFFIPRFYYPRSILIINWLLNILFIGSLRFSIRIFRGILHGRALEGKRTLIIGAGDAGEKLLREIMDNEILEYNPIGFIDDDPVKLGKQIHNIKVLGTSDKLNNIVNNQGIEQILIAIPSAPGRIIRKIIKQCEESNVSFKTIPGIGDLIDGKVNINEIRDIKLEDLLRRVP